MGRAHWCGAPGVPPRTATVNAPLRYHSYFDYTRHPVQVPALAGGREPRRHRIVIVGGGPIGLALALGLARHGVASVVIEADETVCTGMS